MSEKKPSDIRIGAADNYWSKFESGWTNLLTYRYLGRTNPVLDKGVDSVTMPLRHDMRNIHGGIMAAPLCIAAAESGGMHDDLYIPNPITANLQVIDDARGVNRVRVLPITVKLGRNMGFSRSLIVDDNNPDRVIALSSGSAITLGSPPPGYRPVENPPLAVEDRPDMPSLPQAFGLRHRDVAVWEIPALERATASPDAALHLGPQYIALEACANELIESSVANECAQVTQWQIMFVARGKAGPFRTKGTLIEGKDALAVQLSLVDIGDGDRVVSSASAVFKKLDANSR